MSDLYGPRLKLSIAYEETRILERLVTSRLSDQAFYSVVVNPDRTTGEQVLTARIKAPPDPAWGVRIGCIAHLYRSALDNLAWNLALLNSPTPFKHTGFLVCQSPSKFSDRTIGHPKTNPIQSIDPVHWSTIESLQPYNRGHANPGHDSLSLLCEINNTDKHRIIHVVNVRATSAIIDIEGGIPGNEFNAHKLAGPIDDGTELGRYPPHLTVKPQFTLSIGFGDASTKYFRRGVFRTFSHIHRRVEEIFDIFADVLSPAN